jgi:hypothetical protein
MTKEREAEPATRGNVENNAIVVFVLLTALMFSMFFVVMRKLDIRFDKIEKGLQPCQITQPK